MMIGARKEKNLMLKKEFNCLKNMLFPTFLELQKVYLNILNFL